VTNAAAAMPQVHVESLFVSAADGLRLYVRTYGRDIPGRCPVVCLPGLTRTEADFEPLARSLASSPVHPRRVLALDYRGRGQSGYDPDWRNYNPGVELADVITVLAVLGVNRAVFVGTSRGGIITMLMAATRPDLVAGAVLNDIGPVIEPAGLMRIKGYVGGVDRPLDYADGATKLRQLFGEQFPNLSDDQWLAWSKRAYAAGPDGLVARYDLRIANTLADVTPDTPLPDLWPQFDALVKAAPVMVIRGALTDILSSRTVTMMREHGPHIEVLEIPDQGHAPLLDHAPTLDRIWCFVAACD
jgi:pimeloyl-ACP methyl ester carboxylesterase